jgi:uncharacterized protein YciI
MIIIKLTYKKSINEVDKYLQTHREFLDYHYKQGLLIASGPMNPRVGGIIIAATNDKKSLASIMTEDPFALADVADYEYIEFTPVKHTEALKDIVLRSEGKLC